MSAHEAALEGIGPRPLKVGRRQAIFHEGEVSDALYRLDQGCVRLQIEGDEGRREVITFIFPGEIFSAGYEVRWASAYAVSDSLLSVYSMSAVLDHARRTPSAAIALLSASDALLDDIAHHLALSHAMASVRLRWFLQWLSDRIKLHDTGAIPLPMSRRDIADFLGVAPETVSRMFQRLERRGELRRPAGGKAVHYRAAGPREPSVDTRF